MKISHLKLSLFFGLLLKEGISLAVVLPPDVSSQVSRPTESYQTEPVPFLEPSEQQLVLPPVKPREEGGLAGKLQVFVKEIRLSGNAIISTDELKQITSPYENRIATSEDLQELIHKITLYYVGKGYMNSGAVLPDQEVKDNVILLQIIEGQLGKINIKGNKKLETGYIEDRLRIGAGPPLNVNDLQQSLLLLQQGGVVSRVNAELAPGLQRGESTLDVTVEESPPIQVGVVFNNHSSPSIGEYRGETYFINRNLSGWGDALDVSYGNTRGVDDYSLKYTVPLDARDTAISFRLSNSASVVTEAPFDQLKITGNSKSEQVTISNHFWRTPENSLTASFGVEHRSSESFLLGIPFSFSAGVPDGKSAERMLFYSLDWMNRSVDQVVSLRLTNRTGKTNALPKVGDVGADSTFVIWLGQLQWNKRFAGSGNELLVKTDLQFTSNNLMPSGKMAMGGSTSVRGHRENQFLRDGGMVASVEYRVPVFSDVMGENKFMIAPFYDMGSGYNNDGTTPSPFTISSAGLGVIWNPTRQFHAELYSAKAFRNMANTGNSSQDHGFHFSVGYQINF